MSNDLLLRLRTPKFDGRDSDTMREAADRIEELEIALRDIGSLADQQGSYATGDTPLLVKVGEIARAILGAKAQKEKP